MTDNSQVIKCWEETVETLKIFIQKDEFEIHIEPLKFEIKNDTVILTACNDLSKKIIEDKYLKNITETLNKTLGYRINVKLISGSPIIATEPEGAKPASKKSRNNFDKFSLPINPEFCFETFIVGKNNQLAHACSVSVSQNPGKKYNPLFIYGDSGLGKTHLMHAIANYIKQNNEFVNIFYTTGEYFTSLYVEAVRDNKLQSLRRKIRSYDVFMLDDVQFLMNKEGTITEFFHTFNALDIPGKQIILTSDRAPRDLQMDQRMVGRMEQGALTDVTKPDFETRLAILKDKTIREHMNFSDDVLAYIASIIKNNVRLLQSALTKLMAQSSLLQCEITVDFAKDSLDKYYNEDPSVYTIETIIEKTAEFYSISVEELTGSQRKKHIANARHIAIYLARELLSEMSLSDIGKHFSGRDHSTILHSIDKIEKDLQEQPGLRNIINRLTANIIN